MNLHHFYHIWADGNWQIPLTEHLIALHDSGLYDELNTLKIGIVGSEENIEKVKEYLQNNAGDKESIVIEKVDGVEQDTMDKMVEFSIDNDGHVFYANTKGSLEDVKYEHDFRRELNKTLIGDWKSWETLLSEYSIVGAYYVVPELSTDELRLNNMLGEYVKKDTKLVKFTAQTELYDKGNFSSNFFWTHLKYINLLGNPKRRKNVEDVYFKFSGERSLAEVWIRDMKDTLEQNNFAYKVYDAHLSIDFNNLSQERSSSSNQNMSDIYHKYGFVL
jgi:hypothetical protein